MTIADQPLHRCDRDADTADAVLDVAGGIDRLMGDRGMYERMLGRFCRDYAEGAAPLRRALAGADLRLAQRLAHTLKGAAGMIGATAVYGQAALLEAALRTGRPTPPDALATLDDALAAVTQVIGLVPARGGSDAGRAAAAARAPQPEQALLVAQLAHLLDRGDCAALDLLERSAGALKAALGESGFDAAARAAEDFDFEAALAALGRAQQGTAGS
jgi:HPt (histidine-containing phosphotransfer) domain-containing protein